MIDWGELIRRYTSELRARHQSESLCRNETCALKRFWAYCRERQVVLLGQVRVHHLQAYHTWLTAKHKAATCYNLTGSARRFLKWATYRGHLMEDPGLGWQPRCPAATFRPVPTEGQMVALLEAPSRQTPQGLRDLALLEFLYGTGVRVQECSDVELPELDLCESLVTVRGKGGKSRVLPLGPRLTALLREYLANVRPLLAKPDARGLFVHDRGQSMSCHTLSSRVRVYSRKTLGTLFSVHSIRHAYATHLLLGGAPLWAVARLLGHKCLQTTAIYTRMLILDVQYELKRTHPRAQRKAPERPPANPPE